MSPQVWVGIALLGAIGALGRVVLGRLVVAWRHTPFPSGTLAVNLAGGFALGVLVGGGVDGTAMALAGTGLLGAFTTFSTWMVETEQLCRDRRWALAVLNLAGSMLAGIAATGLGWAVGSVFG